MKKTFWLVFSLIPFFGFVLYLGNVLVIGDHIGFAITRIGLPKVACALKILWDMFFCIVPFIVFYFVVLRNIYAYREMCIIDILEGTDREQMTRRLEQIKCQLDIQPDMLNQPDMLKKCKKAIDSYSKVDKKLFLDDYYHACDEQVEKIAHKYAIFAAVSVVLSPKSAGDTLALLIWQCRIISDVLKTYQGRPNIAIVWRLYAKVLMHSFMAGSIDEIMDQFAYGAGEGKMISWLTQALAAVATCVRTTYLTRYYIYHGINGNSKEAARESMQKIPGGIVGVLKSNELREAFDKANEHVQEIMRFGFESLKEKFASFVC